jgi:hypothetical protein
MCRASLVLRLYISCVSKQGCGSYSFNTDLDPAYPKSFGSGSWGSECHISYKDLDFCIS